MAIERVAVVGAGVMGHGIALSYALAGLEVRLTDVGDGALARGVAALERDLALLVEEGLVPSGDAAAARGRVIPSLELREVVPGAELVTECVPESLPLKHEMLARLEGLAGPGTVIASNTSTLPLGEIAARAREPARVMLTHFFNPAHLVPLVEVLPHAETPPGVLAEVLALLRRAGKRPVLLRKACPGFVANRLQVALAREAFALLEAGVASAEDIEAAVTEGPGFRWSFIGPFETADLGGLDTWEKVIGNLAPHLSRAEEPPEPLRAAVRRGDLGAKTGRGILPPSGKSPEDRIRERDRALIHLLRGKSRAAGAARGSGPVTILP
jgi:3-hydroxyacyl-CoA dehydrogenase